MRVHRFYIGRETQSGKSIHAATWEQVDERLRDYFGGFTRYLTHGQWKDEHGKVYNEESYVYECLEDSTREKVYDDLARVFTNLCGQACVLYTWHDVQGEFVYA